MTLRTHTYLIPALCGLGAFLFLLAADFSVHRLVNGSGYGLAAYLVDLGAPSGDGTQITLAGGAAR